MKTFNELKRNLKRDTTCFPILKCALLGDSSTQLLSMALRGEVIERGYAVDLFEADYSQVERQILDPSSDLYEFGPEFTIIFQSTHRLLEIYSGMDPCQWDKLAEDRLSFLRTVIDTIPGRLICFNYPEIGDGVFGSFANSIPSSFIWQIRRLNLGIMELSRDCPKLKVLDLCEIQSKFGRNFLFDSHMYVNTDMLFSLDALPLVASRTMDVICAIKGKLKKCLILDLDGTVWGGIVGDDGWEHIQVGHLGIGKAFTEFQQWIKKLKNRGIIICVCSKNEEDKAKEAFEKNPEMILKLDDIAVFIANWNNKADNIRRIQKILNIGFDAMVFLDDNPSERCLVRENLPEVTVPELPEDPSDYLEFLYGENLFETASYSAADADRTKQYQVEAMRAEAARSFTDEKGFLKSLSMIGRVRGFDGFNIPRVAQLTQRSNQFNLRTVRYTEDQISQIAENDRYACFSILLEDKFGDNGLVVVVILEKKSRDTLFIDTWLMSCRVLKRGMEDFTLNVLVDYAVGHGFKKIIGEYLPTLKNGMVSGLYPSLGFLPVEGTDNQFELTTSEYHVRECFIENK